MLSGLILNLWRFVEGKKMGSTDSEATGLTTIVEPMVQNDVAGTGSSQAYLESKAVTDTRALAAELCRHFYTLGWVSGTGGSIAIKVHDDAIPKPSQLIVTSPSGVCSLSLSLSFYLMSTTHVQTCMGLHKCM